MASLNLSLKKYKVSSEGDVSCDDRISNLPNSILYFSLSFLPIIESIRTSPITIQPLHLQDPGVFYIIQFNTHNLLTDNESFLKILDGCPILHSFSSKFVKRKYVYTFNLSR
ncbi:hypothetical protein M9H77_22157 [Catharanthus roseus]|uniref:Uncharacterized protein n=1 Tax=Catharanthus roseus TaxID=4058 RepID=A0ACC0ARQ2_CATRO|nr:hypothetical protein M9H77_22157 [Catharanthus roseus]